MADARVHGKVDAKDVQSKRHADGFDRALEAALKDAGKSFAAGQTHNIKIEFRAEMAVTNPGRIQSYIATVSSDDDPPT